MTYTQPLRSHNTRLASLCARSVTSPSQTRRHCQGGGLRTAIVRGPQHSGLAVAQKCLQRRCDTLVDPVPSVFEAGSPSASVEELRGAALSDICQRRAMNTPVGLPGGRTKSPEQESEGTKFMAVQTWRLACGHRGCCPRGGSSYLDRPPLGPRHPQQCFLQSPAPVGQSPT